MRIHHFTIPAHDPERVARVLAELLGARVIPIPHPPGTLIVYAGDADGSLVEIMPAATRGGPGDKQLGPRDLPLPEAWPHHGFVTTDALDADRILATFAREGWKAELAHNGPPHAGHDIVRGWIENHTLVEMGGCTMQVLGARAVKSFTSEPDIKAWSDRVLLNPARMPAEHASRPEVSAALERVARHASTGLERLTALSTMR